MADALDRVEEELGQRVDELSDRVPMAKVHFIGRDEVQPSNVKSAEVSIRESNIFDKTGALIPPYDPATMCKLHEHSSALRQNIDSYAVNIDGFGHTFEPIIDLDAEDADEKVSDAIYFERLAEAGESGEGDVEFPTDEEVEERMESMVNEMRLEKAKLTTLFEFCCLEESFITLRTKTRQDKEVMGNGFWEILRNGAGQPVQFTYVPGFTVRLMPLDKDLIEVDMKIKRAPLTFDTVKAFRRFRRYVQIHEGRKTFFKEFGDPRVVSARTGVTFEDDDALQAEENTDGDEKTKAVHATEMIHFAVHSPRSPYGVPRWVGALLAVLGIRQSEEVNFLYFDNKSVPPLAVLVSGGRLTSGSVKKIEDFVETRIKGRKNFHSIMVIEAEAAEGAALDNAAGRMRIEIKPLTDAQQKDGLFLNYDERSMDKVGMSFRLPRLLRGDIRDFNRACYDEQTETLTLEGWKRLGEFESDDRIAAYDPQTDLIEFVKPAALHVYDVDEELLHFQSGVADIMVTEDHTMLARSMRDDRFTVHRSQSIPWTRYVLKTVVGGAEGNNLSGFALPKSDGCKIERGHDHTSTVDGDTFVAFLGYWLSEGSLLSTKHPSAPYLVTLSQKDGPVADEIYRCLKSTGWVFSENREEFTGMRRWVFSNRCLSSWLRENCGGGATEKRVPDLVRELCSDQLRILFDTLMAGDGHWDSRPNRTSGYYPSISRGLCDDMQAIAIRLGYRASLNLHYPADANRHECWRVCISEGRDTEFRTEPKRVHYQGRVYCFSVPKHGFFVTRRNGKIAIQGNTADAALDFTEAQVFAPERGDFDWMINRKILAELEIRFHTFVSNSPASRNPIDLAEIVASLVNASVLTPEEARELAKGIFNRDFKKIDDVWTKIPPELLKKGILPDDEGGAGALLGGENEPDDEGEDEDVDEEMDELENQLNALALKADISTTDLEERGGAKVPAQGLPRRGKKPKKKKPKGFVRLPAKKRAAENRRFRKLAQDLIRLREMLDAEERLVNKADLDAQRVESQETETIVLSKAEFAELVEVEDPAAAE